MKKQQTVQKSASVSGIALHSGVRSSVTVTPAEVNTGIVFRRTDMPGKPLVHALASNVADVRRGTAIAENGGVVFTVEHIMSALNAWHIDNCIVDMDGMEPPILDGSALGFFDMIGEAGVVEQDAPVQSFTPTEILYVEEGDSKLVFIPGEDDLRISCTTEFAGCPFNPQFHEYTLNTGDYRTEIAGGRTFVDYKDLRQLFAMGLCKGGSLDAAAIIHDGAIICKEALRYDNEIVRHKILDLIGDIYLSGLRVTGTIIAIRPGHPRNVKLAGIVQQMFMAQNK
jgi:UDP-3-O-acyl N-acetylglucosamine deacetylase